MLRSSFLGLAVFVFAILCHASCCVRPYSTGDVAGLIAYDHADLPAEARGGGAEPVAMYRNSDGSQLFVRMVAPGSERVIAIVPGPIETIAENVGALVIGEDRRILARQEQSGEVRFASGEVVSTRGRLGGSPGGEYSYFAEEGKTTVFLTKAPRSPLFVSSYRGVGLFAGGGHLYLLGAEDARGRKSRLVCQVVDRRGWRVVKELTIDAFGGHNVRVLDMDPGSGRLLVEDADVTVGRCWNLYDVDTGSVRSIGGARAFGLFHTR